MAQKLLVDYLGDTQCFPLVYKLTISVIDYYGQYTDSKCNSIPNTLEFAKLLKSMAPAATTIEIACQEFGRQEVNPIDNFGSNSEDDILKALANVLYASTKRANLYMYKAGVEKLSTIDDIPPLSSINFGYSFSQPAHKVLVRKSASTLQYLDIDISNANMILYGTDGEAVVYPNLQHLQLRWCAKHDTDPMVVTAETVLFPVLRTLQLGSHYPFNNDVLFRGNAATLEYLQITLDRGDVSMFNRCKTFENKHKVLRHVIINEDFGDTLFVSQADEIKLLKNLMSVAQNLKTWSQTFWKLPIVAMQRGQTFDTIRVLNMHLDNPSFFNILSLVKALPALVNLNSSINGLGPELENIAIEELPDHIASTYCNTGKNLQAWEINNFVNREFSLFIDLVLLLALACPKLRVIKSKPKALKSYSVKVANALESGSYSKYATELNRMINAVPVKPKKPPPIKPKKAARPARLAQLAQASAQSLD
ncbi:hypothetical protein GGH92_000139 [Coemansia sp. RSA 2673]|nr:hypothetical protein GGH92_000139 [Coemansia sp. RSA 2673]